MTLKTYIVTIPCSGIQTVLVGNCKSKAQAMRKAKERHTDCEDMDFTYHTKHWSVAAAIEDGSWRKPK